MKPPGQLGDGDRNIPIAERSRSKIGATLSHALTRIRRDEGVDPERYPPVKADIEYDTRRTMIGAEITARETADIILPLIRSNPSITAPTQSWTTRLLLIMAVLLGITTTTLSWLSYQAAQRNQQIDQEARAVGLRRDDYLRAAYLGKAIFLNNKNIKIEPSPEAFTLTLSEEITREAFPTKVTIPHQIPPEEYERLLPKK